MSHTSQQSVKLHALLSERSQLRMESAFIAAAPVTVRGVALVSHIEQITSLDSDLVIVLSADVARGSWMVSAALRYAWERHAAALIIPERSLNSSVLQLAERFSVSLLTSSHDLTEVAIAVAAQFGFARAQLVSSLHELTQLVDESEDVDAIIDLASQWLQNSPVSLEVAGAVVRSSGSSVPSSATGLAVPGRVAVPVGQGAASAGLLVTEALQNSREHSESVLQICATKLRALLAEASLAGVARSLPPLSLAALGSQGGGEAAAATRPHRLDEPPLPEWATSGGFVAVCLLAEHFERYGASLHQLWLASFPGYPLARAEEGWVAFLPAEAAADGVTELDRLGDEISKLHLLNLQVGASRTHFGEAAIRAALHEAWLAARVALNGSSAGILRYDELPGESLPRLLPPLLATEIFTTTYPALSADAAVNELLTVYCAYASNLGSATATAEQLGIHRNTVSQRLDRLALLGLPIGDPEQALGLHLLLNAVTRDGRHQ